MVKSMLNNENESTRSYQSKRNRPLEPQGIYGYQTVIWLGQQWPYPRLEIILNDVAPRTSDVLLVNVCRWTKISYSSFSAPLIRHL